MREKQEEKLLLDRRGFLKSAAFAGATAAAAGALAACTPSGSEGSDSAAADSGTTASSANDPIDGTIVPENWLGEMPTISDADVVETVDVDVVILGGGHAGTQAALGAAQLGASVAVVESQGEDTYVYFGDDICSYNSQFMTDKGFGGYNTGEIVSEFIRRGCGRVSAPILRLFVENSGEMMDNMVNLVPDTSNLLDLAGQQCIIQIAYGKDNASYYPYEVAGYKAWATTLQTIGTTNPTPVNGREGLSRLTEIETYIMLEAQKLGATWYWEHTAAGLIVENDTVTGAYAQNADGGYIRLNASKGVLLACGDFASNPDMVYNLLDDVNEWSVRVGADRSEMTGAGRDGMGQRLGCWAGGAIEPHPRPSMNTMGGAPGPWGTTAFLLLNANGDRFVNEAMAQVAGNAVLRQPLGLITTITDANYMEQVQRAGLDHGAPNWGYPPAMEAMQAAMAELQPGPDGGEVPQVAIINITFSGGGPFSTGPNVWCADTIEELLDYLGYEGDALQNALASIKRYNELCAVANDTDFGKDANQLLPISTPPFYGSYSMNSGAGNAGLVTLAGMLTDENLNVMKADRSGTIKGLYAAGNCLGQRYGVGYSTPSAGNSMGMAMTHGRMAGKIIASL